MSSLLARIVFIRLGKLSHQCCLNCWEALIIEIHWIDLFMSFLSLYQLRNRSKSSTRPGLDCPIFRAFKALPNKWILNKKLVNMIEKKSCSDVDRLVKAKGEAALISYSGPIRDKRSLIRILASLWEIIELSWCTASLSSTLETLK